MKFSALRTQIPFIIKPFPDFRFPISNYPALNNNFLTCWKLKVFIFFSMTGAEESNDTIKVYNTYKSDIVGQRKRNIQ